MPTDPADIDAALRRSFGIDRFRPGQRDAVEALIAGRDALVILPTGTGKSLVFQLAALLLPGTALVVSPLIALMRDQLQALRAIGFPGVAALNSQIPQREQRAALADLAAGRLRLLYVTPERCASEEFQRAAGAVPISLFAVDEAHCISEWGHDFRSSYLLLDEAARRLGRPAIAALTATATPWVRDDIVARLGMREPRVVVRGFDRPNLFLEVYQAGDERAKRDRLLHLFADGDDGYPPAVSRQMALASAGGGIVYTALTKSAREISQLLNRNSVRAAYYHGQLKAAQRNAVHTRFHDGSVRAIAATNAFGLGIDRADLRFVVHYDAPPSLEAYYQEAGRAGRDGAFARCALLFSADDLGHGAFAAGSGALDPEALERVAAVLDHAPPGGVTRAALTRETGVPAAEVARALDPLVAIGAAAERRGRYRPLAIDASALQRAQERDAQRQTHDRTRIEMVRAYARSEGCRRQFILQYLGEYDAPASCDACDRCVPRGGEMPRPEPATAVAGPFRPGDRVEHESLGPGIVQHVEDDRLVVHFAGFGYRTLDLHGVIERAILYPAGSSPEC